MDRMENTTVIFADGASKGNPGPGGWGALVAFEGRVEEFGGAEDHTTNNRMELTAALRALEEAAKHEAASVVVHTDSSYVINGITKWVKGWKVRGWVTKEGKPVLNRDLWELLDDAVQALDTKVQWKHVGGHVGVAGNERVDAIASSFAEGSPAELFSGSRSSYTHDIENISHDETKLADRSKSRSRSSAKAYSYVSLVDGEVMTHKTWGECEARVKGKMARFKKALSPSEEASVIAEFSKS
jgi:ribonuclease HI